MKLEINKMAKHTTCPVCGSIVCITRGLECGTCGFEIKNTDKDDITKKICGTCDYLNNDISISKKQRNCKNMEKITECEVYMKTNKLQKRVDYLNRIKGTTFFKFSDSHEEIDFYDDKKDKEELETEEESSKYVVDMLQSKNCDLIAFIKETRVYFEREMGGQSCWTEHIDKLIERVK